MSSWESSYAPEAPPLSAYERDQIPDIARDMYHYLRGQEAQMMFLGDFIAELREFDVRSLVLDEILQYMTSNKWVVMWKRKGTDETWISVA